MFGVLLGSYVYMPRRPLRHLYVFKDFQPCNSIYELQVFLNKQVQVVLNLLPIMFFLLNTL